MKYEPFEEKKIEELDFAILQSNKPLLPWYQHHHKGLQKPTSWDFIQACKFDSKKSLKSILEKQLMESEDFPYSKNLLSWTPSL